jgi:hypothetical protein
MIVNASHLAGEVAVKLHLPISVWPILLVWALGAASAQAVPVSHLEVKIVTGAEELGAGSSLELRIYEAGKTVRRLPLVHGEAWPRDSTHIIPVKLSDPLDPGNVVRFSLYYRSASPLARRFEIVAADVELPSGKNSPELLLNATLSGVITGQGELATVDREQTALACRSDADCDDKRTCNGQERCAPHAPGADARGCVKGTPVVCPVNQVCSEGVGCRGVSDAPKP